MHEIDRLWFATTGRAYRLRHSTDAEASTFTRNVPSFPFRQTLVRASDGARVVYAFAIEGELSDACDEELAAWFDDDLDVEAARGES